MTDSQPVHAISVRVPPFWDSDPDLWFAQLEHQFLLHGIKRESTIFSHLVGILDPKVATVVKDIIIAPPDNNAFSLIKCEIISRLGATREQKIRQLLEREDIGDRKPSVFLRFLKYLGGSDLSSGLLKSFWLSRLPINIQTILATQDDIPLENLAKLADKVMEVSAPASRVDALQEKFSLNERILAQLNNLEGRLEKFESRIDGIEKSIKKLSLNSQRSARSRSSSRRRSPSPAVFPDNYCWYHAVFGDKATKCKSPCQYKAGKVQYKS